MELCFMSSGVFLAGGYSSFCFMDIFRVLGVQETLISSQSVSVFHCHYKANYIDFNCLGFYQVLMVEYVYLELVSSLLFDHFFL